MPTHTHKRLRRTRRKTSIATVIGLALCVTAAGCGGSGKPASSPTTHSSATTSDASSAATSTTITVAPGSSTTVQGPSGPAADYPAAQPTPPSLAGAYPTGSTVNLVTVIKTLTTYEDWLYAHPNPSLVSNFMLSSGNDYASEVQNLSTLRQKGWHTDSTPTVLQWAKVTLAPVAQSALLNGHQSFRGGLITIVQILAPGPYLNAAGQIVGHEPNGGPTAYSISLAQTASGAQPPDGQFRILDVTQLHPAGGITALEQQ